MEKKWNNISYRCGERERERGISTLGVAFLGEASGVLEGKSDGYSIRSGIEKI